ncbi:MAG: hypothetical protein ACRD2I_18630 [Vicinamibacterales bacterium]
MTRSVWAAFAMACATAAAVSADAPTTKVTGCVQNISAKGTSGPTEKGYLLTNVTTAVPDALSLAPVPTPETTVTGAPTGTSGTAASGMPASGTWVATTGISASPSASRAGSSYMLEGREAELKKEVGHKVEITGTLRPRPADAPKSEETHLQVDSIRVVASKCTSR